MNRRPRRALALVASWVLGAACATAVGVWAVATVGADLIGNVDEPLSSAAVERELGGLPSATPSTPAPTPSASPRAASAPRRPLRSSSPSPTASRPAPTPPVSRVYALAGGTVAVRCSGTAIQLLYATPRDGFGVTVDSGAPRSVAVRFLGHHGHSEVSARCVAGVPTARVHGDPESEGD